MRPSLRALAPALAWATAIWMIGGLHSTPSVGTGLGLDKVVHFGMYAVLAWLLVRAWRSQRWRGAAWLPLLLPAMLGAADELRQRSVAGRSAEFADWIADVVGASAGVMVGFRIAQGQSALTGNDDE